MFRVIWWALIVAALAAVAWSWADGSVPTIILALRLAKSAVLIAVATILFRRRPRDAVAALLGLSFLLWTISSSVNFVLPAGAIWPALLDRLRFLPFAFALLLFPDGEWRPRSIRLIAAAIVATFVLGCAETVGLFETSLYLPFAIGCVLAGTATLAYRYLTTKPGIEKQQLKWVSFGLFAGIGLILTARAVAWLTRNATMPLVGAVAIESMFQSGIIVLALGFLISMLRYRLYDAEAAISRSAAYAGLTLALVGTFAASEATIQTLGQRYFGPGVGDLSGGIAAAVAAVLLTPLHGRISHWAEQYFQHDLAAFKHELPDLLTALSAGASVKGLAATVLPRIEAAVQSTRMALLVDNRLVATQGIDRIAARKLLAGWQPRSTTDPISRDDDAAFPLHMALHCPLGSVRGWLLLGPRPDGSYYGKDDLDALAEVGRPLQRTLILVAEREAEQAGQYRVVSSLKQSITALSERLDRVERGLASASIDGEQLN